MFDYLHWEYCPSRDENGECTDCPEDWNLPVLYEGYDLDTAVDETAISHILLHAMLAARTHDFEIDGFVTVHKSPRFPAGTREWTVTAVEKL